MTRPASSLPTDDRLDDLLVGKIKRLVRDRGFGFIRTADGREFFFHRSVLAHSVEFDVLSEEDEVLFRPEQGPKGPKAAYVTTP